MEKMVAAKQRRKITRNGSIEAVRDQAVTVGEDVRDLAQMAGKAVLDQMNPLEEYVRERPLRALLMAAGAGALIGFLMLRR
ncbi:MAG: hypothetical protein JNG88_13770 [Phycisphaerales bacterium]|nr:hypothetical protein [Phycisphaerales bacterium]